MTQLCLVTITINICHKFPFFYKSTENKFNKRFIIVFVITLSVNFLSSVAMLLC